MPNSPKPPIRVIHHLARSGGTLISRCLGSMQHVMLLSEIHPLGVNILNPTFNPIAQAQRWYGLLTSDDIAMLKTRSGFTFADAIELIYRRCSERNQTLLIRDWTHLDFTAVPFYPSPSYRLITAEVLRTRFDLIQTTTVRHPVDQWLSLSQLAIISDKLPLADFLRGYRMFAEHCAHIGFVRYEDFTNEPEKRIRELCERLEMSYDNGFLQRWSSYNHITGETGAASMKRSEIAKQPRKTVDPKLLEEFEKNPDYHRSLELLGYTHAS